MGSRLLTKSRPVPLAAVILSLGLCSCDSVRSKLTAWLDEAIGDEQSAASSYQGAAIRHITDIDYEEFTHIKGHVVIVDFYADWCAPCRQLSPVLNELVDKHQGRVLLGKVDIEQSTQLAQKMKVRGIPDVRLFVDGKQVDRFVGMPPVAAIHQRVERQLAKLKPGPATSRPIAAPAFEAREPVVKRTPDDGDLSTSQQPAGAQQPEAGQPVVQPMDKDWLPPGLERK